MADFYGTLSSTSFRVKDREAWLADPDVQKIKNHAQGEDGGFFLGEYNRPGKAGYWAFGWYGQYPSWTLTEWDNEDNETEFDIPSVLQRHILPGDVCQIGVSGNEKLRYIGGAMCWITSAGIAYFDAATAWDTVISPGEIRRTALRFGKELAKITRARPQRKTA